MYDRFTDRTRKVMALAELQARRRNHAYIGAEHILLGLIEEGSGIGANVLLNLRATLPRILKEVDKFVRAGPRNSATGDLPLGPTAKKAMAHAIEEARRLDHDYLGTEHLLLGLLREEEGVAAAILMNLGLRLTDVREEVLNLLGMGAPAGGAADEPPPSPLVETIKTLWMVSEGVERQLERVEDLKDEAVKNTRYEEAAVFRDKQAAADALWQGLLEETRQLTAKAAEVWEQLKQM